MSIICLLPIALLGINKLAAYIPITVLIIVALLSIILLWIIETIYLKTSATDPKNILIISLPWVLFALRLPILNQFISISLIEVSIAVGLTLLLELILVYKPKLTFLEKKIMVREIWGPLVIIGFWVALALATQVFASGYHFTDDHEIVRISYDLQTNDVFSVIREWISNDLGLRFRPVFYIMRILLVWLTNANIYLLGAINFFFLAVTSLSLYKTLRNLRLDRIISALFPLLFLVGVQAEIWWRLGVNETPALLFLSLSVLFLSLSFKKGHRYKAIATVFMVLSALSKESFTLLLPAYMSFLIWTDMKYKNKKIIDSIQNNLPYLIILGLTFLISVYIILTVVGTNAIGYAGVETSSFSLVKIIKTSLSFISPQQILLIGCLSIIGVSYLAIKQRAKLSMKRVLTSILVVSITLIGLILIPQSVLYAKSGIVPRYLIPGVLFPSVFILLLWQWIKTHIPQNRVFSIMLCILLVFLSISSILSMYTAANSFSHQGQETQTALDFIMEEAEIEDNVLVIAEPASNFEWGYSLNKYLTQKLGIENTYMGQIILPQTVENEFSRSLASMFLDQFSETRRVVQLDSINPYNMIIVFKEVAADFYTANRDKGLDNFQEYHNSLVTIYY